VEKNVVREGGLWVFKYGFQKVKKKSNLKEGKIGPIKCKFFIFFFLSIFYLPLFSSVTKQTIPRLKKYVGGGGGVADY
jgi:hypothetical protein